MTEPKPEIGPDAKDVALSVASVLLLSLPPPPHAARRAAAEAIRTDAAWRRKYGSNSVTAGLLGRRRAEIDRTGVGV
jgi:hypothetical protein